MAVVARNNLAPESQQWRKELEKKVNEISLLSSNLSTLINGVNAKLSAITSSRRRADERTQLFVGADEPVDVKDSDVWMKLDNGFNNFVTRLGSSWLTYGLLASKVRVGALENYFSELDLQVARFYAPPNDSGSIDNWAEYGLQGARMYHPTISGSIQIDTNTSHSSFYSDSLSISDSNYDFQVTLAGNGISASSSLIGTTTTTSNSAIWVSGGVGYQLRRNTSLREYKVAYEDVEGADFLAFKPRKWFDRGEVEDAGLDPETATAQDCLDAGLRWVPGFIAEEVEETDPLFASYNGGVLSGVAYDRLAVAVHNTLSNLDSRLKKLENACSN